MFLIADKGHAIKDFAVVLLLGGKSFKIIGCGLYLEAVHFVFVNDSHIDSKAAFHQTQFVNDQRVEVFIFQIISEECMESFSYRFFFHDQTSILNHDPDAKTEIFLSLIGQLQ